MKTWNKLDCLKVFMLIVGGVCFVLYRYTVPQWPLLKNIMAAPPEFYNKMEHMFKEYDGLPVTDLNMNESRDFFLLDWGPRKMFIYKVFWDDRNTTGGPFLRFLVCMEAVITDDKFQIPLYCYTSCGGESKVEVVNITTRKSASGYFPPNYGVHKKVYHKFILPCNVSSTLCVQRGSIPDRATIGFWKDFNGSLTQNNSLAVTVPKKPPHLSGDLALCVTVSFGNLSAPRLVEWLEMQKLLGVSKVMIYNDNIQGPAVKVLEYYTEIGFVKMVLSTPIITNTYSDIVARESFMHNDCMYTHLYQYRYFMMMGLDDVVMPLANHLLTIPYLLEEINHNLTLPQKMSPGSYIFKTVHYIMNDNVTSDVNITDGDSFLLFPSHKIHTQIVNGHLISIHNAYGCASVFNHHCELAVARYPGIGRAWIGPSVARDSHYRYNICNNNRFRRLGNIPCIEKMENLGQLPLVKDDTIDKYARELTTNVNNVHIQIGF